MIRDDTVCNKTKPSSQAQHTIEHRQIFIFSHLEGKSVWGHQVQATLVQCGEHSLIYEIDRYDKTKQSKIDDACNLTKTMPIPPKSGYALVDSWYTCPKLINAYAAKGYQLIGALKTNRILYPQGIRVSSRYLASYVTQKEVRLVAVNGSSYWVYRYEGVLNGVENAVVLFCWPKEAFQKPKTLHVFLCMDVSLETHTILNYYSRRWSIEIFFRQSKGNLGFNKYQVVLIAFTHMYCTIGLHQPLLFGNGLRKVRKAVKGQYIQWIIVW